MSKKINPTSSRIGIQLQWRQTLQNYNFKSPILKHRIKKLNYPVVNLQLNSKPAFFIFFNKINSQISVAKQNSSIYLHSLDPKLIPINLIIKTLPAPKCYVFNVASIAASANLVTSYALFLFKNQVPLRKILLLLNFLLKSHLKMHKVVNTKIGVQIFFLKGFSFSVSGRFENSSTQMSKTIKQTVGTLPLVTLENYIEFSTIPLFFKLGKCNLKVWLFYSSKI